MLLKVWTNVPFGLIVGLSNAPSKLGENPEVAVWGTLSLLVQVTVVPVEIVNVSNVKPWIWEDLVAPDTCAPGVGVGKPLAPEPELPPVNGVGLGVGNLVAVGRITVDRTWGMGVAVANRDLVADTNGVDVALRIRVAVGAILSVGVGTALVLVGASTRVEVATGVRVARVAASVVGGASVAVAAAAPVVGAGTAVAIRPKAASPPTRARRHQGRAVSGSRSST